MTSPPRSQPDNASELLPCPFCGSKAKRVPAELEAIRRAQHHLEGSLINSKGETALSLPEKAETDLPSSLPSADSRSDK